MKFLPTFILFLLMDIFCYSQTENTLLTNHTTTGQVYAIVVGVANYYEKEIPQLQYANRDAEIFAQFLKSKAGGSVPAENIQLLIDSAATSGAIYTAIYELSKNVKQGDLVYFYFSGHGDLETITKFNDGFLICYDSPPLNYVKLSFPLEYLNKVAITLTTAPVNANMVLITDACHSGVLAGNALGGKFLVGNQLREIRGKEIRITSSAADQLSNENEAWGGGRGVFSWYLVNGLKGGADKNNDAIVTLDEIKEYLSTSFNKDALLKKENIIQTPVLNGRGDFQLAKVDSVIKTEMLMMSVQLDNADNPVTEILPPNAQDYFFSRLQKESLEDLTDSLALNTVEVDSIAFIIIKRLKKKSKTSLQISKLTELGNKLYQNNAALKSFNGKLAVAFDKVGQQIINQYLKGDEAEMERRRYYNAYKNNYDVYVKIFELALKLTSPDNEWYTILKIKLHYFTGVSLRLKIPTTENSAPLIEQAIAEQQKALALVDDAAYIYNELGILFSLKNQMAAAEQQFKLAIKNSNTWAIPHVNLMALYTQINNLTRATEEYSIAKTLHPDFQGINVRAGVLFERKGNLLLAEELHRKSIHQNSRHYLPFERLGFVYTNTTQYALADSFFYEAELRKKGFKFKWKFDPLPYKTAMDQLANIHCAIDTAWIKDNDAIGQTVWGLIDLKSGHEKKAERHFKKAIAADPANPIAFHYLGKILFAKKRWQEAEIIFKFAVTNHLEPLTFRVHYRDSLYKYYKSNKADTNRCILTLFMNAYYGKLEDYYFLGAMYESWGHLSEAADEYQKIININPHSIGGYAKLWTIWEKLGRYADAENVIVTYCNAYRNDSLLRKERKSDSFDFQDAYIELNAFYKRMVQRFPNEGIWYYKTGRLLYQLAADNSQNESYSVYQLKVREANKEKEFAEPDITKANSGKLDWKQHAIYLPGTFEQVYFSPSIKTPFSEEGIAYLKKADSLLNPTDDIHAEINDHVGDMFTWLGLPYLASTHYQQAVDARPDNATTREKLADSYGASYQLQSAMTQLDSLFNRKEINFPKQVILAKYYIHSGKLSEAKELLTVAEINHPYKIRDIIDLNGRLLNFDNKFEAAIIYYKQLLQLNEKDSIAMYSIARLYAKLGNVKEAWKWLNAAVRSGFKYTYVLRSDPYLAVLMNTEKWKWLNTAILEAFEGTNTEEYADYKLAIMQSVNWKKFIK